MDFSKEELLEARRQIDSTLHKLRETIKTFEAKEDPRRYKSQITLAKRRVEAFTNANALIERELSCVPGAPRDTDRADAPPKSTF